MSVKSKNIKNYILALVESSKSKGTFSDVSNDIEKLNNFFAENEDSNKFRSYRKMIVFLTQRKRRNFVSLLVKELKLSSSTASFLNLLLIHNELSLLPNIVSEWKEVSLDQEGYVKVTVTSVIPITDDQKQKIINILSATYPKLYIENHINKNILGGIIIQLDSFTYDDSIKRKINKISQV